MPNRFFVLGANHRTLDISLRGRLSLSPEKQKELLCELLTSGLMSEAAVLSTCNRIEVYGTLLESTGQKRVLELLGLTAGGVTVDPSRFYAYRGRRALAHLFRVASSLDSQIVGETQILGQVKESYRRSCQAGGAAKCLNIFFQKYFQVAKKVRNETNIAFLPVSTGSCATALAQKILGDLEGRRLLVVGAGSIAETVARHFSKRGAELTITNRTRRRAETLCAKLGGQIVDFEQWRPLLVSVEAVAFATQSPYPLLTSKTLSEIMRLRRNNPLLVLDLSVPLNVEPAIDRLESVFSYDLDQIQGLITANQAARVAEAEEAERIVEQAANLVWNKVTSDRTPSGALIPQPC
jgi:glutamyl-tRNA reductase